MEHVSSRSLRALCALLAAVLLLLCACGTENSAESPDPEESSADESEAVISAEESETEESMAEHEYNEDLKASGCRALVSGGAAYTVSAKNTGGEGFLRMNIACPRSIVRDGLSRLKSALSDL